MSEIHIFNHNAMATQFQVRIAGEEKTYAAQTAQAAFALVDELESRLSRFRANSEISQIAQLAPGEKLRLSEPVFTCLEIARRMELVTRGAFSATAAALKTQAAMPLWSLAPKDFSIRCDRGKLELDLGAIGKGFALDRMAEVLREWDCPAFLLVAGGSSILAGDAPAGTAGWSCGLGDDNSPQRYWLKNCSLSGSGLTVKGQHILDPRTGRTGDRRFRAWALADTAAESDALSTAAMVLSEMEITGVVADNPGWLFFLPGEKAPRLFGARALPSHMPSAPRQDEVCSEIRCASLGHPLACAGESAGRGCGNPAVRHSLCFQEPCPFDHVCPLCL
jgi:thiamine biosynthesis lipoprotein